MTGLAFPKPAKRGPRPRKPIARTSRPSRIRRTVRGREQAILNTLFSVVVRLRDPFCEIERCNTGAADGSRGVWGRGIPDFSTDAAHLFGKGAHPKIRWDLRNAVGACRACHSYMTRRPKEWAGWLRDHLHVATFEALMQASLSGPSPDRAAVRVALTAELNRLGRAA